MADMLKQVNNEPIKASLIILIGNGRKPRYQILFGSLLLLLFTISPVSANPNEAVDSLSDSEFISDSIAECKQLEDQDPAAAITLANKLLSKLDRQLHTINYGHVLGCLGWAYTTQNELTSARSTALDIEQLVAELAVASVDSIQLARRAGGIFHRMGDRVSASENYSLAMQQAESLKVVSEQIPILVNLGVLNSELREHEQAIDNYYQALDLMAETDDFRYHPPVLFNLAATLNGQRRFAEGLKVFQQVEAMISDQWPPGRIAQTYQGLAAAHSALGDLPLARDYAEQALQILTDNDQIHSNYYNIKSVLASIYVQQGETELAIEFVNDSSQYYLDPNNRVDVLGSINPLSSLAFTYERLGLLNQAIEVHKADIDLEQEMQDTFNQEIMAQMQVRLNDSQQREALALLKNERINDQIKLKEAENNRKLWVLMSSAAIMMFLMFLFWQYITNRKLKRMTLTDTLTQLGNRRAIKDWLATHKMPNEPGSRFLWLIDLDDFKAINDEYDYDIGDFSLQKIAAALSGLNNKHRLVARWGGEEFVLLTDDVAAEDKDDFSQLLLNTIKQTQIETGSISFSLTASVGISKMVDQSPSAWSRAMYQADRALYTAKDRGQDCVVLATGNN